MIELLKYIFLGLVQGITELLPVSSSGHVTFYSYVLNIDEKLLTHFLIITNLGSFIAMFIHYRKDVFQLTGSFFKKISGNKDESVAQDFNLIVKLIIAVLPISIVGFLVKDYLEFSTLLTVGIAFIVTAVFLLILYLRREKQGTQDMTHKKSAIYGLIHVVALLPGISRSGTGYFSGLIQDVEIKKTIRFTFLLYLIISIPVSILGLYDLYQAEVNIDLLYMFIALVTSFLGTFLLVNLIHKVITFNNFKYFSMYAFIMGMISIVIYFI